MGSQGQNIPHNKLIFAPGSSEDSKRAKQFTKSTLERESLDVSPFIQFNNWFGQAQKSGIEQCEACTLSTASLPSGRVSARFVYLKELDESGFVIFSNWGTSRKAADIESNPHAALTFWWREFERQVRVEGSIERMTREESQVYFDTRLRSSRIGAWASPQSNALADRNALEEKVQAMEDKFNNQDHIPVPDFWGGARIIPDVVEFWQGRHSRLHDRFEYSRHGDGWKIQRLSP